VKFHLGNAYRKLDVSNRLAAARSAHRPGLGESVPNGLTAEAA
jgi:DNA-binding CsgD family transcriptional regulator